MSIRRNVTFPTEDVWRSIQGRAKLFGRTVGEYLSWLHAIQSKVTPLKVDVPDLQFVDSEELDRNPDLYPPGTIGIVPEDHPNIVKKPINLLPEAPVSRQDVINGVADGVLVPEEIVNKEPLIVNIEEPEVDSGGTGGYDLKTGKIENPHDGHAGDFFVPYSKEHQTRKSKRG